nr:MAG TPA: NADH dehydrogenase [Caudoviricetes sp.]
MDVCRGSEAAGGSMMLRRRMGKPSSGRPAPLFF